MEEQVTPRGQEVLVAMVETVLPELPPAREKWDGEEMEVVEEKAVTEVIAVVELAALPGAFIGQIQQ
jgi:hypothetical protein